MSKKETTFHTQIVEDMPNHLFRPILAASKRSLLFQLTNLPERLHLHALDASHPSIAATSTLQICITRQREQSTLLAPLVSKLTSLESLSLRLAGVYTPSISLLRKPRFLKVCTSIHAYRHVMAQLSLAYVLSAFKECCIGRGRCIG